MTEDKERKLQNLIKKAVKVDKMSKLECMVSGKIKKKEMPKIGANKPRFKHVLHLQMLKTTLTDSDGFPYIRCYCHSTNTISLSDRIYSAL